MVNSIARRGRRALGIVKDRLTPTAAELKARQQLAFSVLDPQVRIVKRSPTAQIAFGSVVSGLLLTGNWGTAAVVTGCWLGSRPLTHVVAGGVGAVGLVDAKLLAAIERLQATQIEPA